MKVVYRISCVLIVLAASVFASLPADAQEVREKALDAPNHVKINVRMEGPYTADVPLQIVCYFKYTPEAVKRMSGAPVELDKRLGGVIASLRERGEFAGARLETLCIMPPKNSIKAKALLLIGLGSEDELSLNFLEDVGRTAVRVAATRGVNRVGFAPLIRDQGSTKLSAGAVETAIVRGMLLAYDTDKRMQQEGLAVPFTLDEWNVEAGPQYFDETVTAVEKAIQQATTVLKNRSRDPYVSSK
jgi:hypothetical protein